MLEDQSLLAEPEETGPRIVLKLPDADVALLLELTDDFLRASTEAELMQVVGGKLAAHLKLDSFNYFDVDEARGDVTNLANWNAPDVPDLRGTYHLADHVNADFVPAMRAGHMQVIADTRTDPRASDETAGPRRVRSAIIIPYHRDGAWKGCFVVTDRRPRDWTTDEIHLVRQVATRAFTGIERIRAQKGLVSANQRLTGILSGIHDALFVLSPDWNFVYANEAFVARVAMQVQDLVGRNIWEIFPKGAGSEIEENLRAAMEQRELRRFETRGKYADAWYSTTAVPSPEGLTVLSVDITRLKRAEKSLQESEERYRQIVETANEGIWQIDKDVRTTFVNPRMAEMLGYRADEILGRSPFDFMFPEDRPAGQARLERAKAGTPSRASEFRYRRKDGSALWALATSAPRVDEAGDFLGSTAMLMDITERIRAREALRERDEQLQALNATLEQRVQEKTAEARQLAADITRSVQSERRRLSRILHDDLQQRVFAVQMQLGLLRDRIPDDGTRSEMTQIEKQLREIRETTRDLSLEMDPPILHDEDLVHAIDWLAESTMRRHGLAVRVHAEGPLALGDPELHVFLVNCVRELLFNTVKHAGPSHAEVSVQRVGDRLQIVVGDNGRGHHPAEPGEDEGSESFDFGILAMRRQLTVFGGGMEILSRPGSGTRTIITIPMPGQAAPDSWDET